MPGAKWQSFNNHMYSLTVIMATIDNYIKILNNIFPQHVYPELTINKDLDSSNMWRVKVTLNIVHPITQKTIHSPVKFIYTDWKKTAKKK